MLLNPPLFLEVFSTAGIIFGLGHFYFGYVYHVKKTSWLKTLLILGGAVALNYFLYLTVVELVDNPLMATGYYYITVLFLFVLHNFFDLFRLGFKKQAYATLGLGFGALYLTLAFHSLLYNIYGIIGVCGIWFVVFYHYIFWIIYSRNKMPDERRKKFEKEATVVHLGFLLLFGLTFLVESEPIDYIFSYDAFHHLTSIHIIFSALKEWKYLK